MCAYFIGRGGGLLIWMLFALIVMSGALGSQGLTPSLVLYFPEAAVIA